MSSDLELWEASAEAWLSFVQNDVNRTRILDPVVLEMCGSMWGKRVLDVGCGEGRFSRKLATRGADVIGIDPTETFLQAARSLDPLGDYVLGYANNLQFRDASIDAAVYYLSLCDLEDLDGAMREAGRVIRPGGHIVIADLHPLLGRGEWKEDSYNLRGYIEPASEVYEWSGLKVRNYHRPFSVWANSLSQAGFVMENLAEPVPSADLIAERPGFARQAMIPNFVVMRWRRDEA